MNFLMDEGQERIRATYRDTYERLVAIKKQYDQTNFFRVNQNIRPEGREPLGGVKAVESDGGVSQQASRRSLR